jgi:hypothetical protein
MNIDRYHELQGLIEGETRELEQDGKPLDIAVDEASEYILNKIPDTEKREYLEMEDKYQGRALKNKKGRRVVAIGER